MKKNFILFFFVISYIPQTLATHYDIILPIPLNPVYNNSYLQSETKNTIQIQGLHVIYTQDFNGAPITRPDFLVQSYLCITPRYNNTPLFDKIITNSIFQNKNNHHSTIEKNLILGSIGEQEFLASYQFAIFSRHYWSLFNTNAGMYCNPHIENWNHSITKNDTIALRIQYPIDTPVNIGKISTKIASNYATNYKEKENSILIGTETLRTILANNLQIKKATAELLNGSRINITSNFKIENITNYEHCLIPIDTAVLHFDLK